MMGRNWLGRIRAAAQEGLAPLGWLRVARSIGLSILACALLPALLGAQDVRFELSVHLEGYGLVRSSEFAALYSFDEFVRWNGQTVSEGELRDIRDRWRAERERVAEKIDQLRADPPAAYRFFLKQKLSTHPYFVRVRLVEFSTHDPFFFMIQAPRVPTPGYEESVIELYGSSLLELENLFQVEVARPLRLERRELRPASAVIVLSGREEYARYVRTLPGPALFFAQAHYDSELDVVVTYMDSVAADLSLHLVRRPVLHEMVHGLRHAYAQTEDALPRRPWFDEGLASLISSRIGAEEFFADGRPTDELAVRAIGELSRRQDYSLVYALPLEELCSLRSYEEAFDRMGQRALGREGDADYSVSLLSLYGQACMWAQFLARAEEGRFHDGWIAYVGASLAGTPGPGALRKAFGGEAVDSFDAAFAAFLTEGVAKWAAADARVADLEASFRLTAATAADLERSAKERGAGIESLAPDATQPDIRFALALWKARTGAFSAALRDMQALVAYESTGDFLDRVERERVRLEGMIQLRKEFLEHLSANDRKLNLVLGDRRLLALITEVNDTEVILGENRLELDRLRLDEMDPAQLVRGMKDRKNGFAKHWLFAYPYVLGEEKSAKRMLKGDEPGVVSLREDAAADYPARLRLAKAINVLTSLVNAPVPKTSADGRAVVAQVAGLLEEFSDLDLVARRQGPLLKLAYRGQGLLFEEEGLASVTNAKLELLGEGRVRLTYDFEDAAQGQDFEAVDYLHEQRWSDAVPRDDSIEFAVQDGALQGFGSICSRHFLEFQGQQSVKVRYLYRSPQRPYDTRIRTLLGICDDGNGGFITADTLGGLSMSASRRSALIQANAEGRIDMDTAYEIALEHDGQSKVVSLMDNKLAAEIGCGPRLTGSVFIWVTTDCQVEVLDLVIEGKIADASLRAAKAQWIEDELSKRGIE